MTRSFGKPARFAPIRIDGPSSMPIHRTPNHVALTLLATLSAALILGACDSNKFSAQPPASAPSRSNLSPATTQSSLTRFEYAQIHMGMRCRLVVYAASEDSAVEACRAAFARVAEVDRVASDYLIDSELNRMVRAAATQPVKVSDDLWTLLTEAHKLSERTDGAFDITVGPYVKLWRKARQQKALPGKAEIAAAGALVGYQKVMLDPKSQSVRLALPGMKLDLGGIAKGYAGDHAIATLRAKGIRSAFYEAGGDIVVADAPPGKEGWAIGIADHGPAIPESLVLANSAISTSGDTEQFVEIEGRRYSHVVDPRTGIGMTARAMGTVTGPRGLWTDGLSKSVYLIPADKVDELLNHYPGTKAYVRTVPAESGVGIEDAQPRAAQPKAKPKGS